MYSLDVAWDPCFVAVRAVLVDVVDIDKVRGFLSIPVG